MTARERLLAEAAQRILITDGAFGTEIQNWKLGEADYAGDRSAWPRTRRAITTSSR